MSHRETRFFKSRELRVARAADGTRSITGYAIVFNTLSVDFGGWAETVSPTAVTRTLQESPDVLCLYNHHSGKVLGRTTSGTLTLDVDNIGLHFTCVLPDTTVANDLIVSIERGDIDGCSFGFICRSDVWTAQEDGSALRTLMDVDLFEVTITSEPAYPETSVSLRSAPKEVRSRILAAKPENRDDHGDIEENSAGGCECDCAECLAGDCVNCSDTDCDDPNCICPENESRSYKHKMEMRLRLALHYAGAGSGGG
jgi:HK97 family phage prohead protease